MRLAKDPYQSHQAEINANNESEKNLSKTKTSKEADFWWRQREDTQKMYSHVNTSIEIAREKESNDYFNKRQILCSVTKVSTRKYTQYTKSLRIRIRYCCGAALRMKISWKGKKSLPKCADDACRTTEVYNTNFPDTSRTHTHSHMCLI